MNSATLTIVIVIAVIVILAIGAAVYRLGQKRRSERLHERFGPEYDRAVENSDGRRGAESQLRAREKRHQELELRTLDAGQQRQFEERWSDVQRDFVDGPGRAVHHADRLVVDVMSARGYPVDDFDQRADDLSVQYPKVTQRYREARQIARANERGEAGTEELRNAVTSYRSLVDALLHDDDDRSRSGRDPAGAGDRKTGSVASDGAATSDRAATSDKAGTSDNVTTLDRPGNSGDRSEAGADRRSDAETDRPSAPRDSERARAERATNGQERNS
jgi:hypothetical protein